MREEQRDIEPRDEVEQKYARDECVFRGYEIEHE